MARVYLCCLITLNLLSPTLAAPWLVTKYYEQSFDTWLAGYTDEHTTRTPKVDTEIIEVTPTADNVRALETSVTTKTHYTPAVTVVDIVIAPDQGAEYTDRPYYDYYVHLTYTWPSSCTETSGLYVTDMPLREPPALNGYLSIASMVTSVDLGDPEYDIDPSTQTYAYVDPTDLPSDVLSKLMAERTPYNFRYCNDDDDDHSNGRTNCDEYYWILGGNKIGGGECCSDGCHHTWGLEPWSLAVILILGWFGIFFIIGLIQSVYNFRKLMTGQKVMRGLPTFFLCLMPLLSCLLGCCMGRVDQARSPQDQQMLKEQWKTMSFGKKFGLWLRYGFSYKYPEILGPAPPRAGWQRVRDNNAPMPMQAPPPPPQTGTTDPNNTTVYYQVPAAPNK